MSLPRENVVSVPSRNVVLTGSGWRGARTRSSHHDPARPRSAGGIEESGETAHHTAASGRGTPADRAAGATVSGRFTSQGGPCGNARSTRADIEPEAGRVHQPASKCGLFRNAPG